MPTGNETVDINVYIDGEKILDEIPEVFISENDIINTQNQLHDLNQIPDLVGIYGELDFTMGVMFAEYKKLFKVINPPKRLIHNAFRHKNKLTRLRAVGRLKKMGYKIIRKKEELLGL